MRFRILFDYSMRYAQRILEDVPAWYWAVAAGIFAILIVATRKGRLSLLAAYAFVLLTVTVLCRRRVYAAEHELSLFWSYRRYFASQSVMLLSQMVLNVIVFIPVGVLLRKQPFKWAALLGLTFSACIEVLQLATQRGFFELDDMFHNTLGVVIGYGIAAGLARLAGGVPREEEEAE